MCNNIPENKLRKKEEVKRKGDSIKEWIENRPELAKKNIIAIKNSKRAKNAIEYSKQYPLYLNDGTKIFKIETQKLDSEYIEVVIEYQFKDSNKKEIITIKRYVTDSIEDIEKFFGNCQSIYQNRNIDLKWKI